jgi:hypothetical protein
MSSMDANHNEREKKCASQTLKNHGKTCFIKYDNLHDKTKLYTILIFLILR